MLLALETTGPPGELPGDHHVNFQGKTIWGPCFGPAPSSAVPFCSAKEPCFAPHCIQARNSLRTGCVPLESLRLPVQRSCRRGCVLSMSISGGDSPEAALSPDSLYILKSVFLKLPVKEPQSASIGVAFQALHTLVWGDRSVWRPHTRRLHSAVRSSESKLVATRQ